MTEQRLPTTSYSRLEIYEKCPLHAWLLYGEKRPVPEPTADNKGKAAATRGKLIHKLAENFILGKIDTLPTELEHIEQFITIVKARHADPAYTIEVEQQWGFTTEWAETGYFAVDVWDRVVCDVVQHFSPEHIEVDDWKTGKKDGNEVKHSQQGQKYGVSTLMRYPACNRVDVRFIYCDYPNKQTCRSYERKDLPKLLAAWDLRMKKMTNATVWPAKPNKSNCRFCPYSPNEGGDSSCLWGVSV